MTCQSLHHVNQTQLFLKHRSKLRSSHQSRSAASGQLCGGTDQNQIAKMYGLQGEAASTKPVKARKRNPYVFQSMKAKVNIPGVSARCLQSKIRTAGLERTSAIQLQVLEMVHKANLGGRWIIKADGCDIHKGLRKGISEI